MTQTQENNVKQEPALVETGDQPKAAAGTPAPAAASVGSFVGNLAFIFLVACAAALTISFIQETFFPKPDPTQKVVVIDVNKLIQEQITVLGERGRSGELALEEMPKRSKAFSEALLKELRTYSEAGYIVLRMDSIIAKPDSLEDLTSSIRTVLQNKGLMEKAAALELKP